MNESERRANRQPGETSDADSYFFLGPKANTSELEMSLGAKKQSHKNRKEKCSRGMIKKEKVTLPSPQGPSTGRTHEAISQL